jgi:iduronate 2-sulfatase
MLYKSNVLFIAVDDLKPMLKCYGENHMVTPNIDRLAKMGTIFMNNYCQQAVCAPTRASLLTGQRPDYTRVWDLKTLIRDMNPTIMTLPQYFKENGYATTGIGKVFDPRSVDKETDAISWSIPYDKIDNKDYAEGYGKPLNNYYQSPDNKKLVAKIEADAKSKGLTGNDLVIFLDKNRGPAFESADVPDEAYTDGANIKKAVAAIAKLAKSNQPFFYAAGISKPHLPFCSPKKYWDLYDHSKINLAAFQKLAEGTPEFAFQASGELVNNYVLPNGERYDTGYKPKTDAQQRDLIHGYYAAVSFMDAQVGKLLDALKANGIDNNTIVVLWGDHGWHLGDHTMWCKHSNFEQATRTPLIIATPQYKGNQKAQGLTEFVDVFPTLTELAGLKTPDGLAGKSLVPLLKDPKKEVKNYAQSQYFRNVGKKDVMGYAIRTKRYRYVAWFEADYRKEKILATAKPIAVELYDYVTDPNEMENMATKSKYQKIVKEHEKLMTEFLGNQKQSR